MVKLVDQIFREICEFYAIKDNNVAHFLRGVLLMKSVDIKLTQVTKYSKAYSGFYLKKTLLTNPLQDSTIHAQTQQRLVISYKTM